MTRLLHKILLTTVALLTAVGARAHDVEVDGIYYNLNKQELTASVTYMQFSTSAVYQGNVVIPAAIVADDGKTYAVTRIGYDAFYKCVDLVSVTLPDGITSIESEAFNRCNKLTSINIPDGVTSIGGSAFSGCNSLTSISIPDGVTSIGVTVFCGCSSLSAIDIPDGVTSIGDKAFIYCSSRSAIDIPDGVTSIGSSAFSDCYSLTSITIPSSVTSIRNSAFSDCISLTSVTLPDGVTSIEPDLFDYCSGLTSITIPAGVTSVGERAFYCCTALATVYSFNPVPPTAGEYCFVLLPEDATLYVPEGSVEAYRNAEEWKKFKNIKEFDPAGISDVRASRNSKNARYDLSGRRLTAPVKGLNIVGGKKVMVK